MSTKPITRGFLSTKLKRDLIISFAVGIVAATGFHFAWVEPHKQKYADFYKTYDANADFERMRKAGVFNSCSAD